MNEHFFKVSMSDDKKEIKFEVKGLSPMEVIELCSGTINTAIQQIRKGNLTKITKPTLNDAILLNKN